ncbi:MAG: hypothetical protein WEC12_03935 [Balneolaceae bacterium]
MILKKFLGKTLKAAKKSARQMYGDDFVIPETDSSTAGSAVGRSAVGRSATGSAGSAGRKKDITVMADLENRQATRAEEPTSPTLKAIRKYAEEQNSEEQNSAGGTAFTPRTADAEKGNSSSPAGGYTRRSILTRSGSRTDTDRPDTRPDTLPDTLWKASIPGAGTGSGASTSRGQREITALHKRFDKLEALLDSALISANFDYVSHPAFQQLVQTGISTSVIAGWFSDILEQGVDPYDQPETFMAKLAGIIRTAIEGSPPAENQKYMLFTGPSGAGKTQLIMKLALHPDFLAGKKTGLISLIPQGNKNDHYYTILEPFCREHDIPWFKVKTAMEVTQYREEWDDYDHLLIDTPSISTEQENSFRQYWKLRQMLASLTPLEVHYVVNAAFNRYYFRQSSANHQPLQPDYVAITHLDEVTRWGHVIPFLNEMGCPARYVSTGDTVPASLSEFKPSWFAKKVLQEK